MACLLSGLMYSRWVNSLVPLYSLAHWIVWSVGTSVRGVLKRFMTHFIAGFDGSPFKWSSSLVFK